MNPVTTEGHPGPRPATPAPYDVPLASVDPHAHAWTPEKARSVFRSGVTGPTAGVAAGHTQANLISVPADWAYDMLLFCQRNPKPCPVLDVTDAGAWRTPLAAGADLRTDLPRYRVWEHGELVAEPTDVVDVWREDLVSFLIGCSFTFESALTGRVCRCATSSRAGTSPCTSPTARAGPPGGCGARWWCRCVRCRPSTWPP